MKKERATMSDEARERLLIAEQIERARADAREDEGSGSESSAPVEEGLKRDEGERVVLSLSTKPAAAAASSSSSSASSGPSTTPAFGLKLNALKANPLKANPLKRPNPLKATATDSSGDKSNERKRPAAAMSAAERLILEEQERKRRRMEREGAA
jgi:DNA/RNA-binding protein KIN17